MEDFHEINAVQCQFCGEIFEDIAQAEDCSDPKCPHPMALAKQRKIKGLAAPPQQEDAKP